MASSYKNRHSYESKRILHDALRGYRWGKQDQSRLACNDMLMEALLLYVIQNETRKEGKDGKRYP
jgi:hypothetical protein